MVTMNKAAEEKHRVEVKQRVAKKEREQMGVEYKPKWFIQEDTLLRRVYIGDSTVNIG